MHPQTSWLKSLRGSAASRSLFKLSTPCERTGASFEAASRRLRTRGMGVTSYPRNAVPLEAPKVGHADPAAAVLAPAKPFQWVGRQNLSHNQVRPLLFGPQFDIACLFTSGRRAGAFHDGMDVFTPPVGLGQGAASPGGANGRESQSSSRRKRPEAGQGGKKRRG
jgi:hypothetical protein